MLGAVLAGGRSMRFGTDKALATVNGRTLIELAVAALRSQVPDVIICGRAMAGVLSVPDRPAPDQGPLGGLNAALHHAMAGGYEGVVTIGCDMPLLEQGLVGRLIGSGPAIVEGHYLVGYWPAALASGLDHHLSATSDRSIRAWVAKVAPRIVALKGSPLPNINTPGDLEALRHRWPPVHDAT